MALEESPLKKLAVVLPVLVLIAAIVFFAVHRRATVRHVNDEIREAAATHFSLDQQLVLARIACGSGQISTNAKKEILCSLCPPEADSPGTAGGSQGWTLDGAIPGSFSGAEADEALLHATGCESRANHSGGNFLMRRIGGQWSTVRYVRGGMANDKCQKLTLDGGRDALVCEVTDTHAGIVSDAVQLLQFDADKPSMTDFANSRFLAVTDESSSCGSHAKPHLMQLAKIEKVEVLPAGSDGRQDVAIDVVISRVSAPTQAGAPCPAGSAQRHHLVYNNAGDHFDAGEGYVALHAMKREDCCDLTVTPKVMPGRY